MTDSDGTATALQPTIHNHPTAEAIRIQDDGATSLNTTQKQQSQHLAPPQRNRDAVISHLIETLPTPSVLSKRYDTISTEEAADVVGCIEEEAFVAPATPLRPRMKGSKSSTA
ncbi:unnamed protein product [Linum tenue]|uniref:WPP domain-containing protein n=1 Tax=Linum tenue TaxID=586396 RepID=A0AAV0INB7_9ROSI|nr:unnamed protein product [Linum tenue]